MTWRYILVGDGLSPHLLKWAKTLHELAGDWLELGVVSSRGLLPEFDGLVPAHRQLLLNAQVRPEGGNMVLLRHLPQVARWLRHQRPDIVHAHYLSSHGLLAWLSQRLWRVPGRLVSSAWGSDILVTPNRSWLMRHATAWVLRASAVCTADSRHMAREMLRLGAREVTVFPFGLDALPPLGPESAKDPNLFFSNRALEPNYRIDKVLRLFAAVAAGNPQARLVLANDGSQVGALRLLIQALRLQPQVAVVGYLDAQQQSGWYQRAQWHLSLPHSDSVSVSVLEAMAHGCIPVLSDLPANRELVTHGLSGWIVQGEEPGSHRDFIDAVPELLQRAPDIAAANRDWVARHGLFAPQLRRFLSDLGLGSAGGRQP